jgi:hypothetical protein
MPFALIALFLISSLSAWSETTPIRIPDADIVLIKSADAIDVDGTNPNGGVETFTIHDAKAIREFVALLADDRYIAAPKSLKPDFKSKSRYKVRFFSHGAPVLELQVIAMSVLDIPGNPSYYMESERYSDLLMAPLRRLR